MAGKTGTAQQPDPNHGGAYSSWMNWDTFAGMVPADNPQFVVAIMVDNPAHGVEGGDVAAPLFHQIATYEVQHAHIPPTGSLSKHVPLQVCDAVTAVSLTQYRVLTCRPSPARAARVPRPAGVRAASAGLAWPRAPAPARRAGRRRRRSPA